MSLGQLTNKLKYTFHNLTYDPDAEAYAKELEAKRAAAEKKAKKDADWDKKLAAKIKQEDKDAKEKAEKEAEAERRRKFSISGMIKEAIQIILTALLVFFLVAGAIYGACLATNLNIYHSAPYRVLYAIYGFFFFWLVIPYTFLYRGWWLGKGLPRFYALLPLVPYRFNHPWAQTLLGWMSFRPDDNMYCLEEWKPRD